MQNFRGGHSYLDDVKIVFRKMSLKLHLMAANLLALDSLKAIFLFYVANRCDYII